jgi:hypothetical protein
MAERRLTESMNVQLAVKDADLASKEAELASKEAELALEKSKRVKAELAAKAKILRTLIKLAGTEDDPYFCGKDVCTILGYSNIQKNIFRL